MDRSFWVGYLEGESEEFLEIRSGMFFYIFSKELIIKSTVHAKLITLREWILVTAASR